MLYSVLVELHGTVHGLSKGSRACANSVNKKIRSNSHSEYDKEETYEVGSLKNEHTRYYLVFSVDVGIECMGLDRL